MLIPYSNPEPFSYQERYNRQQSRGRITIECAFGVLKNLFQCLRYGLRNDSETSCKIILACVCLYNLRFQYREPEPPPESEAINLARNQRRNLVSFGLDESADEIDDCAAQKPADKQALADGRLYRDRLAQQYFK